jgi:phospholipase C
VRIPALIVSPWVEPGSVSKTLFDHTSNMKTILRFCPEALIEPKRHRGVFARLRSSGHPRHMGTRVSQANDLGELLTRTKPRPAADRYALIEDAAERAAVRTEGASIEGEDPLDRRPATELQIRLAAATRELRRRGHPADRP